MEKVVVTRYSNGNSYPGARYIDPVLVEWADFLLRGGDVDLVPPDVRESASIVAEAARILEELKQGKIN
jgi:hypothetical protein